MRSQAPERAETAERITPENADLDRQGEKRPPSSVLGENFLCVTPCTAIAYWPPLWQGPRQTCRARLTTT
jgi:hypothetical protein